MRDLTVRVAVPKMISGRFFSRPIFEGLVSRRGLSSPLRRRVARKNSKEVQHLHQGIAQRAFQLSFWLNDYIQVTGASLKVEFDHADETWRASQGTLLSEKGSLAVNKGLRPQSFEGRVPRPRPSHLRIVGG